MKRFSLIFALFFLLFNTAAHAKDYTIKSGTSDTVQITTAPTTASISYTHTGSSSLNGKFIIYELKSSTNAQDPVVFNGEVFKGDFSFDSPGTKTFSATGLRPKTKYYFFNYVDNKSAYIETEDLLIDPASSIAADPLKFKADGGYMDITGKIDITKQPYPELFTAQIEYSSQKPFTTDLKTSPEGARLSPMASVNKDGTYSFRISNIAETTYWYRQVFYKDGKPVGVPTLNTFNGGTGFSPTTPQEVSNDFEDRSYRLLAPLPGLTVLLDPDLCREKQLENPGAGQICDINSFLNFLFKLMIGAAAVVLVIRIIIEGFRLATTDVLAIKMNSKEKLLQGIWGLLLALSAWLILNTINPKLVANDITIPSVTLDVEEETYESTIRPDTGIVPTGPVAKCSEGVEQISTAGGKMTVCKSLSTYVKTMVDTAWSQGIKLSGGGFRTAQRQIELRRDHCGAANIYVKTAKCIPPTAFPGHSNHESGLAVDFMCEGVTIATRDNKCFLWLQNNAKNYHLINFSKEPWHWSVNGR